VGKPEGHVVAQVPIAGQDHHAPGAAVSGLGPEHGVPRHRVAAVGRKQVVPLLAEHGLVPHVRHDVGDLVVVHQLRIAKGRGPGPKQGLHGLAVQDHLLPELRLVRVRKQPREGVVEGLFQELDLAAGLARLEQLAEQSDHLGSVSLGLFQERAGHAQAHLERRMGPDQVHEQGRGGHITLVRHLLEDLLILQVPEEGRAVGMESMGLMELEVECH